MEKKKKKKKKKISIELFFKKKLTHMTTTKKIKVADINYIPIRDASNLLSQEITLNYEVPILSIEITLEALRTMSAEDLQLAEWSLVPDILKILEKDYPDSLSVITKQRLVISYNILSPN